VEDQIVQAKKSFALAIRDVKLQAQLLLKEIEDLHLAEAEIKFGLSTCGELGVLAVGKLGMGMNYEITLKWKKTETK
jgi:hypothetical protein